MNLELTEVEVACLRLDLRALVEESKRNIDRLRAEPKPSRSMLFDWEARLLHYTHILAKLSGFEGVDE